VAAHDNDFKDAVAVHATCILEFQKVVAAHATHENELKDEVAAHATRGKDFKDAVAAHATREVEFKDAVAAHATREVEFKDAVAAHATREVELKDAVAVHEVEFQKVVAAREIEFKDAVAVHATRVVEWEEAIIVRNQCEADFGANSAREIEHFRLREVELVAEALSARTVFMTNLTIATERETSLQTQVMILSKKIESAEEIYTSKRRERENIHLKQLDSIAKAYCDLKQTDLQRCQQEFQAQFREELQTRSQALVQRYTMRENKTSNLFKIEHARRVKAEYLLESERNKVWTFVSVRTASLNKEKDVPCID
jgi:hypothetical protein